MTEGTARYAQEHGTWFITLIGDLRHPLGPALNALLDRALADDNSHFVIDLTKAEAIDSTCLGILARLVNRPPEQNTVRPVIITGGEDINELLLAVCFDRMFDLVASSNITIESESTILNPVTMEQQDMLNLLLDAHRRLSAIDAKTHAIFKDVVDALEAELLTKNSKHAYK